MLVAMPTAMPAAAVDQQVGQPRRQHRRLLLRAVVVGREVDRVLVDVGQHLVRDLRQADLGVAHGRGVVAVDAAEVALAVDQHVAQAEVLRHAHDGVVHRRVAVRVVLADHVADDARALLVRAVPVVVQLVHREQHAPMHRLEAVARVGQGTPDDHAHRVVEVRPPHLLFEADGEGFLGELGHEGSGVDGGAVRVERGASVLGGEREDSKGRPCSGRATGSRGAAARASKWGRSDALWHNVVGGECPRVCGDLPGFVGFQYASVLDVFAGYLRLSSRGES
jgi:hypothetical protein